MLIGLFRLQINEKMPEQFSRSGDSLIIFNFQTFSHSGRSSKFFDIIQDNLMNICLKSHFVEVKLITPKFGTNHAIIERFYRIFL